MLNRRQFVQAGAVTVTAALLRPQLEAQVVDQRPPTVDTSTPHEIAEGVWVVRDHRVWLVPNIGIIAGRDAALVVDTGLGPANGERVLALARSLVGSKKLYLTMTHFHPEHGYGAQVFEKDATIVYNRAQRDELEQKGSRYIELFKATQSKAAAEALDGTRIVMPQFVYDGSAQLDLGGRVVELHSTGLAHTRGDQIVHLHKDKILFAEDLIEERMFPIFPYFPPADVELDGAHWSDVLAGFAEHAPRLIVPGHGDPGPMAIALQLKAQMDRVREAVTARRRAGQSADKIIAEYKPEIVRAFPTWEHAPLLDLQIRYNASLVS